MVAQNTSKYLLIFKFFRLFNKPIQKLTGHTTSSLLIMDVVCDAASHAKKKINETSRNKHIPISTRTMAVDSVNNWEIT